MQGCMVSRHWVGVLQGGEGWWVLRKVVVGVRLHHNQRCDMYLVYCCPL